MREVGELLFRSLFNAGVYGAYKASIALTQRQGLPLRIVLRTQVPELAALPWEMMYDTAAGAYLCQRDPLIRHVSVASPSRPLEVRPPLRVLGMVSAPRDKQRLDVDGEKHRLNTALGGLGARVQLKWVQGGSWADLQGELVLEHMARRAFHRPWGLRCPPRRGGARVRRRRRRQRPRWGGTIQPAVDDPSPATPVGCPQLVRRCRSCCRRPLLQHGCLPGKGWSISIGGHAVCGQRSRGESLRGGFLPGNCAQSFRR